MEEKTKENLARLDTLAQEDALYRYLISNLKVMDEELEEATKRLSLKNKDKLWDYIMLSEEISRRKLELACEAMEFPDKE